MDIAKELETKIRAINGTPNFPKFMLWILTDPACGLITYVDNTTVKRELQDMARAYQEWVNIGSKPPSYKWAINIAEGTDGASDLAVKHITKITDIMARKFAHEMKKAQLEKIKELQQDDMLYTFDEYEDDEIQTKELL
jgi:hypothetical protein